MRASVGSRGGLVTIHRMMESVTLQVYEEEPPAVAEAVQRGLIHHAAEAGQVLTKAPITLAARDARGELIGGLLAEVEYDWLHVRRLWVDPACRGRGLGTRLMHVAEQHAHRQSCRGIHLNTFGFQARGFYEKLGYIVFGTLPDTVPDCIRYFLRKACRDASDDHSDSVDCTSIKA